ncbi:MAG: hypothetical protein JXD18_01795 [Anaerolineae bacterium]|nr:hypothetical protein [Anaerolineae bacterium]
MPDSSEVTFLSAEQARYLAEMAERARIKLSHFAGYETFYDATALQLLDEWIERVTERTPRPSQDLQVLWMAFLGETFRRRFEGEWVVHEGNGQNLSVMCPAVDGGLQVVEVSRQVQRRIVQGFSESMAFFYLREGVLLKKRKS